MLAMDILGVIKRTAFSSAFLKYLMLLLGIANDTNVVFSPYSLLAVLSVIASGSSESQVLEKMLWFMDADSAQQQIEFIFRFVKVLLGEWADDGDLMMVKFGSGVWIDQSLSVDPSFKNAVETVYKSALNQVDFRNKADEMAAELNLWAETRTGGQIKDVVPSSSVDASTRLVFVNANYFKGVWMRKFNPAETQEDIFYLLDGSSVLAPFMTSKKKQYIRVCDGFKVLGLQYDCGQQDKRQFSMLFFLPDARDGLKAFIEKYAADPKFLECHLPWDSVKVGDFKIPKFKISCGFDASDMLKDLVLCSPSKSKEKLDAMTDTAGCVDLFVSSIFHKTYVEINEDGTNESGESMVLPKWVPPANSQWKVDFVADHPFMFVIRDCVTALALVVGHVVNPQG